MYTYTYVFVSLFCLVAINGCEIIEDEAICTSLEAYKTRNQSKWKKLTIHSWEHIIGDDAFNSTPNLIQLTINGAYGISKNTFRGLLKLEKLTLDNIAIDNVPDSLFEGLPLTYLRISNTNLKSLKPGMFKELPQLNLITLNNNKITNIPSNVFSNTGISQIDLSNNSIAAVEDCAFCGMTKLMFITLHINKLVSFEPKRLLGESSVKGIGLNDNRLTTIPRFETTPELIGLSVSNNSITTIEEHIFQNCKKMELIDMSHNQIKEIPANILPDFDTTTGLFFILHNNNIECLSEDLRSKVKKLRRITLEENPWKCQCLDDVISWGRNLKAAVSCETFQTNCTVSCFTADNKMKTITYANH